MALAGILGARRSPSLRDMRCAQIVVEKTEHDAMQADPLNNLTTEILQALRDAALAQLEGSQAPYRADVALKSYDALDLSDKQERNPLALEAFVAAVIAHGKRPRRAQNHCTV